MLHTTRRLRFTTHENTTYFWSHVGSFEKHALRTITPHKRAAARRWFRRVLCRLQHSQRPGAHQTGVPAQAHEEDTISAHARTRTHAHEAPGTFCFRGLENSLCERLAPGMLFCVHWEFDTRSLSPLRRLVQQALPAPDCFFCSQPGFPQREIVGARRERDFTSEGSFFSRRRPATKFSTEFGPRDLAIHLCLCRQIVLLCVCVCVCVLGSLIRAFLCDATSGARSCLLPLGAGSLLFCCSVALRGSGRVSEQSSFLASVILLSIEVPHQLQGAGQMVVAGVQALSLRGLFSRPAFGGISQSAVMELATIKNAANAHARTHNIIFKVSRTGPS
jgi:hypothetical protein